MTPGTLVRSRAMATAKVVTGLILVVCTTTLISRADDTAVAPPKAVLKVPELPPKTPAAPIAGDSQDFVYFGDTRPLLVRVHLQIDGKSYQKAWDENLQYVFKYLDRNKDGFLSREEADRVPPSQVLLNVNALYGGFVSVGFNELDTNRDGKVTIDELGAYYRRSGGGPFHFQFGSTQQQVMAFPDDPNNRAPEGSLADQLNDAIFNHLDADHDGKLSRAELATMPTALMAVDSDEDEMITVQELVPSAGGNYFRPARQSGPLPTSRTANSHFALLKADDAPAPLTRKLHMRYGHARPAGDKSGLTRREIGLDQAAFDELDLDKNGELDAVELNRFTRRTPDLELMVRFGKGGRTVVPEMLGDAKKAANFQKSVQNGAVAVDLVTSRLEMRSGAGGSFARNNLPNLRMFYTQQFKSIDGGKGYIEMKNARQNGLFSVSFKMMDLNGDGKVYEKEMLEFLDKMVDLQTRAEESCASLTISDQGKGIFDLLDANRDGRLSIREMRSAAKLVDQLDRDGDGLLSRTEVPRNYLVAISQGPANQGGSNGFFAVPLYNMQQPLPALTAGPLWFRKMDRNRDGDVSRREFIGTDEEFRLIDTDGDGLISLSEAEAADRRLRTQKVQRP